MNELRIATLSVLFFNVLCNSENATTFISENEPKLNKVKNELSVSSSGVNEVNSYIDGNVVEDGFSVDDVTNSKNILAESLYLKNIFDKNITNNVNATNLTSKIRKLIEPSKIEILGEDRIFCKRNQTQGDISGTVYEIKRMILNSFIRSQNNTNDGINHLSSTMSSTVNHFYCSTGEEYERQVILYGAKAWTFSLQDVNLTLSYPTVKSNAVHDIEEQQYIITGFSVVLNIDGALTRGYITSGGILHDHISLTFINTGITSLHYKFRLYGAPKKDAHIDEDLSINYICK